MRTRNYNDFVREFVTVADAMNRVFDGRAYDYARAGGSDANGGVNSGANGTEAGNSTAPAQRVSRLPIDAYANEDAFVLTAYLPGVNPEDVEITFEGEELTIRGSFQPQPENVEYLKRELYHGGFERRLTFNVPVNADAIEATYEMGVLTLRVPKAEAIKPKQIKVQAK
jgi:HSP20 family protein